MPCPGSTAEAMSTTCSPLGREPPSSPAALTNPWPPPQQLRPIGEIADGLDGWTIGALKGQLRSSDLLGRGDV